MHGDLLDHAGGRPALLYTAKIEGALNAEPAHNPDIVFREMAEMVGAENPAPANAAAIDGQIAAKITEIAGACEIEVAGREFCHLQSLGHLVR